jgi:hypothetical protein
VRLTLEDRRVPVAAGLALRVVPRCTEATARPDEDVLIIHEPGVRVVEVSTVAAQPRLRRGVGTMGPMTEQHLTRRDRAILRAVAAGGAELLCGVEPDLLLDGRCCCDQIAAHRLAGAGLIAPATAGRTGQRVPARLTATGATHLARRSTPIIGQCPER